MFDNLVSYEANMDNWQDMQEVLNQETSGSPFSVDEGWIQEVERQQEIDNLDPSELDNTVDEFQHRLRELVSEVADMESQLEFRLWLIENGFIG